MIDLINAGADLMDADPLTSDTDVQFGGSVTAAAFSRADRQLGMLATSAAHGHRWVLHWPTAAERRDRQRRRRRCLRPRSSQSTQ
jgi:hypothetical protein